MLAASIDVHLQLTLYFYCLSLNLEFEGLVEQKANQHLNQKTLRLKLHLFLDKQLNQLDMLLLRVTGGNDYHDDGNNR